MATHLGSLLLRSPLRACRGSLLLPFLCECQRARRHHRDGRRRGIGGALEDHACASVSVHKLGHRFGHRFGRRFGHRFGHRFGRRFGHDDGDHEHLYHVLALAPRQDGPTQVRLRSASGLFQVHLRNISGKFRSSVLELRHTTSLPVAKARRRRLKRQARL